MKKLRIVLSVLAIGLAVFSIVSLQRRVADLERRLEAAPSASQPPPRSAGVGAERPQGVEGVPGSELAAKRISALERRLAKLERPAEAFEVEPPGTGVSPGPTDPSDQLELLARENLEELDANFALYDADGDGLVDADELLVGAGELRPLDLNSDQRVGRDEVHRLKELAANARAAAARLDGADAEFPIALEDFRDDARRFRFLDRNGDGLVSEEEFLSTQTDAVRELRRFDLDHNGALTEAELWDAPTRFAAADLDGDKLVYAWEVSRLMGRSKW